MTDTRHISVMLPEVLEALNPKDGGIYVDATFGAGGYSKAILDKADCKVIALDRDPTAIAGASELLEQYGEKLTLVNAKFSEVEEVVASYGYEKIDGIVFDIGVSSMQIDNAERGFSFSKKGPLDMRMSCNGVSAKDVVNKFKESDIADIIFKYGEERASRRIARGIVFARNIAPIETTEDLAKIVHKSLAANKKDRIDPATKTFQALRIYVNSELDELETALASSEKILKKDGVLVVVTFHSLEDRIVKNFIKEKTGKENGNRHLPLNLKNKPTFYATVKNAVKPSLSETEQNPRSRSAKLRFALRTDTSII
ncbi:MAG: 16S rRNA (cytosine(1402)-N(4))-methyltransferase RsmH [Alphaproteobacteria bacterium]